MNIIGFQPITSVDFPNHLASICFTQGCPLRCPFCHNPELVLPELFNKETMSKEEDFLDYISLRRFILEGVVVSGGEPLMHEGILDFLGQIKDMGYKVKLDTCGAYPMILEKVIQLELVDYVALDFKNGELLYGLSVGKNEASALWDHWMESLNILRQASIDYELRTTIIQELHTKETLLKMASLLEEDEVWYLQTFVKKGKILNDYLQLANQSRLSFYPEEDLKLLLKEIRKVHKQTYIR